MGATGFSGTTRDEVAAVVGDCHLLDDPDPFFGGLVHGTPVFADDDLGITPASCACYRLYLAVDRRVPRERWSYLLPVTVTELQELRAAVDAAPATYTGRWATAEAAVLRLFARRPYLESSTGLPAILRWSCPGRPLAFGFAPF
jgi:hypothetical protein